MTPKQFVELFFNEKNNIINQYFKSDSNTCASELIKKLNLNKEDQETLKKLIDISLTDSYYNLLLAFEGSASLGNTQEIFEIKDEDGNVLTGDLESIAYEVFYDK